MSTVLTIPNTITSRVQYAKSVAQIEQLYGAQFAHEFELAWQVLRVECDENGPITDVGAYELLARCVNAGNLTEVTAWANMA